jgi:protein-disulfide isomerase
MHPRAEFGAEMAEAKRAQEKFWEMHDYLYENQAALDKEEILSKICEIKT